MRLLLINPRFPDSFWSFRWAVNEILPHRRSVNPPLDKLMTLDWAQLKSAIGDSLTHGAIEIGVVGDIDEQAAIDAIAATFGALPTRSTSAA